VVAVVCILSAPQVDRVHRAENEAEEEERGSTLQEGNLEKRI